MPEAAPLTIATLPSRRMFVPPVSLMPIVPPQSGVRQLLDPVVIAILLSDDHALGKISWPANSTTFGKSPRPAYLTLMRPRPANRIVGQPTTISTPVDARNVQPLADRRHRAVAMEASWTRSFTECTRSSAEKEGQTARLGRRLGTSAGARSANQNPLKLRVQLTTLSGSDRRGGSFYEDDRD
jgi:hypothetical protein